MKYFLEYEFKTEMDNYCWFPLFIEAQNFEEAELISITIKTALIEKYTLKNRPSVVWVVDNFKADQINEYVNQRFSRCIRNLLHFRVLKFDVLPTMPELNYSEHVSIIKSDRGLTVDSIPKLVDQRSFNVGLYGQMIEVGFQEFLLIDVMDVSSTLEIYFIVEIPAAQLKFTGLVNEGIWKDAHLKGYKMRVDAPHTPDGKRHVHIAHNKHTHSKDKQVSWNDDKTRHDKKTFDSNFHGMERAKEIARRALGLNDDAILERYLPTAELIVESEELAVHKNGSIFLKLN
ncbi:DUF6367 family protein [Chryseolinea lacunae]|uniref:Uncharacterized protein n=1 Tax=Chryseolinea lacunae TaxID=2801331 RepID=A0ABS1KZI1_9BACT|nr:DUF6367 family protein [Chryseolinea lacunae]MBL0744834.1 hypothetical protein [Chryseolinea lacunae]